MPGKTCHDVSGDKKIDWQLADGEVVKTETFLKRFFGAGEAVWGRGLNPVHREHLPPLRRRRTSSPIINGVRKTGVLIDVTAF